MWRARYFGEWPNLKLLPWLHAYHSSDIPMVFGTSDLLGPNTATETATSKYMQDAWAAFARDPENGLQWPKYDPDALSSWASRTIRRLCMDEEMNLMHCAERDESGVVY